MTRRISILYALLTIASTQVAESAQLNPSGNSITVVAPEELTKRLRIDAPEQQDASSDQQVFEKGSAPTPAEGNTISATGAAKKTGGYRVQVFSDNNPKTAKGEARSKAKEIGETFPQLNTYVVFTAPYWRLRVGDFRTQEEADNCAIQIKKAFPGFAKEVRVIRDRINVR